MLLKPVLLLTGCSLQDEQQEWGAAPGAQAVQVSSCAQQCIKNACSTSRKLVLLLVSFELGSGSTWRAVLVHLYLARSGSWPACQPLVFAGPRGADVKDEAHCSRHGELSVSADGHEGQGNHKIR